VADISILNCKQIVQLNASKTKEPIEQRKQNPEAKSSHQPEAHPKECIICLILLTTQRLLLALAGSKRLQIYFTSEAAGGVN
jgi:hypothetical protein